MNKNLIYGIVAVVVLALIVAFMMNKPSGDGSGDGAPTASQRSLKDLIGSGSPQRCSFSHTTDAAKSSGVVYVASGKMRGDFTSVAAGQTIQSHMIVDGDTSYVWSDAMPQGIKMSFADMGAQAPQSGGNQQSVDVNQQLDYDCSGWSVDGNLFALPAGVEFNDMSAMMKGVMPKASAPATVQPGAAPAQDGDMNATQCAVCDQAPDAASKAECRSALGCK